MSGQFGRPCSGALLGDVGKVMVSPTGVATDLFSLTAPHLPGRTSKRLECSADRALDAADMRSFR